DGLNPISILNRSHDTRRKGGDGYLAAGGTPFLFALMLLDQQARCRNINDLSPFFQEDRRGCEIGLAVLTLHDLVKQDLISLFAKLQGRAWMSSLPSRLLSTFLAQALWLAHKAIRTGRKAA